MNALLISPQWPDTYWSFRHALPFLGKRSAYPPLGLLTIAALLPSHWAKRLVDTNVRALSNSDLAWADVALISGMLVQKENLLVILARCRARGLRTVVGGPIASGFAELDRYTDHVVVGEAEDLIAPLADDLQQGVTKPRYKAEEMPPMSRSPVPDLNLINPRHYSSMAIQYSRGCPFNCEFCDIIEFGLLQALPGTQLHRRLMAEGRIVGQANGNNIECNLSFLPKMASQNLLDGYRSILKRIYAPDAYYERVRRFLSLYHPPSRVRRSLSEYKALCRSIVRQGVFGRARASYWRFLIEAATCHRHAFGTAVTLAIMGHHFYTVTEEVCQTD